MKTKYLIVLIIFVVITSCRPEYPKCIIESKREVIIRWGYHNQKQEKISAFEIDSKANLYYIESNTTLLDFDKLFLDELGHDEYCEVRNFTNVVIVRTQTLNVPADLNKFVEYRDKSSGIFVRGLWNPAHKTVGSRQYRLLYDSLMTLVPFEQKKRLKTFEDLEIN